MFSGIVQGKGKVVDLKNKKDSIALKILPPKNFNKNLKKGASISVDGICLTSLNDGKDGLSFDVIEETISRTNLNKLKLGSIVNLERSITPSTEIGGHLMSGHIHFTGKVKKIINKESTKDIVISYPKKYSDFIIEKGYIGVNGCSLTIGKVNKESFNLHLIPETLSVTNLDMISVGSSVNIEIDQNTMTIVETVRNILAAQKS